MTEPDDNFTPLAPRGRFAEHKLKWAFPIGNGYGWMDDLGRAFRSVDVSILAWTDDDRPPSYSFCSPHLATLSPEDALSRGRSLLKLLNGLLRVRAGLAFHGFAIARCVDIDSDSNASVSEHKLRPLSAFPDDVDQLRYLDRDRDTLSPEGRTLFLARTDVHLRYVLEVMGDGISFVNYYRILDTIKDSGVKNDKDIAELGGRTKSDLKDFTYTANKYQASGSESRHGFEMSPADSKSNTLTLGEADDVMRPIVLGFIKKRVKDDFDREWQKVQIHTRSQAD